ncbi:MAG: hypothetical protein ACM3U0_02185 [archaeon]
MDLTPNSFRSKVDQSRKKTGKSKSEPEMSGIVDLLFNISYSHALMRDYPVISLSHIRKELEGYLIEDKEIIEALERLHASGNIFRLFYMEAARPVYVYGITSKGFTIFLRKYYKNYIDILKALLDHIKQKMNSNAIEELNSANIAKSLKQPKLMVDYFLEKLHNAGKLKISRYPKNNWQINEVLYMKNPVKNSKD